MLLDFFFCLGLVVLWGFFGWFFFVCFFFLCLLAFWFVWFFKNYYSQSEYSRENGDKVLGLLFRTYPGLIENNAADYGIYYVL